MAIEDYSQQTLDLESLKVLEEVYTYLVGCVQDERGETYANGLRRSLRLYKDPSSVQYPNGGWSGLWQSAENEPVNSTAAAKSLKFFALYASVLPSRPRHLLDNIRIFADNLMTLQWNNPDKLIHGGFRLAPTDSRASAFGTATAARGMLHAYHATLDPKYLESAISAADFLLRIGDPNAYWFPKYGENPINRTVGGYEWYGYCDRVDKNDVITTTCSTWNLLAAQFLHDLYTETGVEAYETSAIRARDFMAKAVLEGYDYFAVSSNPGSKVNTIWPLGTSHVYADHMFHRSGDMVGTGTVGTDHVEYGLDALWHLGYDPEALKLAYVTYRDLPHDMPESPFGSVFDAAICFAGYFRLEGDVLGDTPDRHFGTYYDTQGAGALMAFKKAYFPIDYAKSRTMTDIASNQAALLDENFKTVWSNHPNGDNFATQGTIPIAASGIGILEAAITAEVVI